MLIRSFPSGPLSTNAYLAACERSLVTVIIDPAPGSFSTINETIESRMLIPSLILLTHSHWDHIADVFLFKEKYKIPVLIHSMDTKNLEEPGSDKLPCWINFKGVKPDKFIKEGDLISFGDEQFSVIETPGHTPGGVCFYSEANHVLFSGDTLFKGSMGNISFTTGRPQLMWLSLKKLATLPANTKVFPGHGNMTTIGHETWLNHAEQTFG